MKNDFAIVIIVCIVALVAIITLANAQTLNKDYSGQAIASTAKISERATVRSNLIVEKIRLDLAYERGGNDKRNTYNITSVIRNVGVGPAYTDTLYNSITILHCNDNSCGAGNFVYVCVNSFVLQPGQTTSCVITTALDLGVYNITISTDSQNSVRESNENDNSLTDSFLLH